MRQSMEASPPEHRRVENEAGENASRSPSSESDCLGALASALLPSNHAPCTPLCLQLNMPLSLHYSNLPSLHLYNAVSCAWKAFS